MTKEDHGSAARVVTEIAAERPPALVHVAWRDAFPWLIQGTTRRGGDVTPYDLGLFSGGSPRAAVERRWSDLAVATGADRVVHARQVHGRTVRRHGGPEERGRAAGPDGSSGRAARGVALVADCDGHVSAEAGVLLAVTVADCVPIFLVDPLRRVVGVVHAGWRGAAEGVLEEGVASAVRAGAETGALRVHLGPAICGRCYEVGPEVFAALDQPAPGRPSPIDLRRVLAGRAVAAGVLPEHVTTSGHCTRCTGSGLFSHRGGDGARQVGYIGIRR